MERPQGPRCVGERRWHSRLPEHASDIIGTTDAWLAHVALSHAYSLLTLLRAACPSSCPICPTAWPQRAPAGMDTMTQTTSLCLAGRVRKRHARARQQGLGRRGRGEPIGHRGESIAPQITFRLYVILPTLDRATTAGPRPEGRWRTHWERVSLYLHRLRFGYL